MYATEQPYSFTNPLAIEFGFWGFLVWAFYFLTTFYFCIIEPRVGLFQLKPIRWINNAVVIATCAFTAYLFLSYVPSYIEGIGVAQQYLLVGLIILAAVFSSTDIRYVRVLSLTSSALFIALTAVMIIASGASVEGTLPVRQISVATLLIFTVLSVPLLITMAGICFGGLRGVL